MICPKHGLADNAEGVCVQCKNEGLGWPKTVNANFGEHAPLPVADYREGMIERLCSENARLHAEVSEMRVVLRKFYGADVPISSVDIARKMLTEIDSLRLGLQRVTDDAAKECGRLREEAREAGVKLCAMGRRVVGLEDQRDALQRAAEGVEPIDGEDPRDGLVIVERRRLDALRAAVAVCKETGR